MDKKLQVLMELHPCFYGHAGIPQETRLLFSYFLELAHVDSTGFINPDIPSLSIAPLHHFLAQRKTCHEQVNEHSRFIISTLNPTDFSALEKGKIGVNLFRASLKSMLGLSLPMGHFQAKGFEDFLWEKLFAKTLASGDYSNITQALYRSLHLSRHTLYMIQWGRFFPKIATKEYDVFLVQTPFPGRVSRNTQLVVRYHDAVPLFVPHLIHDPKSHQALHYRALCANAKKGIFVCTSHAVRDDLLQVFPTLENRTPVIHDTISPSYFEEKAHPLLLTEMIQNFSSSAVNSHHDLACTYIMMVSTLEPRKNQLRLIRAWERVRMSLPFDLKLLFIGSEGWQVEPILAAMRPWQERGLLFHLQNVPVDNLRLLYQGAACVVCPSVKEGFDLSGIEAMACGGKVVASDISVHREIYGEAAEYFDPYSVQHQAEAIQAVVSGDHGSRLREKGLKQVKSYQKSAIQPQWEAFFETIRRP
ncbi:MAG: glycosyltransferase family 1 protein [Legionellales bacterium]|nr:glycosyltransferase family 1 protein [Legionellales bacterium]